MATGPDLTDLANLFDLLSNPTRLQIVRRLAQGESNGTELYEMLKLSQANVSYHLGLLRMNKLMIKKRVGHGVICTLAPHVKVSEGKIKISIPPYTVTVEGM